MKSLNSFFIFTLCIFIQLILISGVHSETLTQTKKLVILGDSLTEGYGVATEAAFPALIQKKFGQDKINVKVIGAGSSGSTSASGASRLKWLIKDKPDYVLILLGSNDGLRGIKVAETEKNLNEAIELAKKNQIKVALGQLEVPPNYGAEYTKDFRQLYAKVAKKQKIELAPFLLDKVAGHSELNLADGIHPNEKGHKIVADNLYVFLKKWIKP